MFSNLAEYIEHVAVEYSLTIYLYKTSEFDIIISFFCLIWIRCVWVDFCHIFVERSHPTILRNQQSDNTKRDLTDNPLSRVIQ